MYIYTTLNIQFIYKNTNQHPCFWYPYFAYLSIQRMLIALTLKTMNKYRKIRKKIKKIRENGNYDFLFLWLGGGVRVVIIYNNLLIYVKYAILSDPWQTGIRRKHTPIFPNPFSFLHINSFFCIFIQTQKVSYLCIFIHMYWILFIY